jgi:hypothetical protein
MERARDLKEEETESPAEGSRATDRTRKGSRCRAALFPSAEKRAHLAA